jgi:hypothetical protein
MSEHKDRIEQTIEVLVYAPIGAGLYLKDMGPTFVNMFIARGRAEIDRRQAQMQQRTTTARSVGQVALAFGVPMVRQRVEREVDSARQKAQSFLETIGSGDELAAKPAPATRRATVRTEPAKAPAVARDASANGTQPGTNGASRAGDALPIPGYDALSASQVVERLAGLSFTELDAVRSYECAHRNRRTILGKIDQISA